MALSATTLKGTIKTELEALFDIQDDDTLDKFAEALANAIVTRITSDAEVVIGVGSSAGTYSVS